MGGLLIVFKVQNLSGEARHMSKPGKALVMGDDTRSFLATVRSLGRKGIEVHAAPFSMRAPALSSKYISQVHLLPYYLDGGADWLAAMQKLMLAEQFDIIIPCEERTLLPLYEHQQDLPGKCALAIPSQRALEAFFDKINTRQLATDLGVPVAKGKPLLATDSADSILAVLTLPIVAKQRKSYSWPDLYVRTSVKVIQTRSELNSWLRKQDGRCDDFFFEQMFEGIGLGVSVLCKQGAVLQAFEHHRAHELNGSSYYRKSAPLDAKRLAAVSSMVKEVKYTGIAMFEFKLNEANGEWVLLEVNARPWGSLPLPVSMGVDIPHLLYQVLVNDKTPTAQAYPANVFGRNLIGDLWQMRTRLQCLAPRKAKQLAHLAQWVAEFGRTLVGREHQDALVLDDLRPGWIEIKQFFAEHLGAKFSVKKKCSGMQAGTMVDKLQAAMLKDGEPVHLLFVCQGNICRSPYAELKAKQLFSTYAEKITFSSAGMLPRNHRPSPPVAIAAAARHGVDMNDHVSQHAHLDLMHAAELIVVFDFINFHSIADRYPLIMEKVYFISNNTENCCTVEVADPDGSDLACFDRTYSQIDAYLNLYLTAAI